MRPVAMPSGAPGDFLSSLGALALAARLKRLSERMGAEARVLYAELGLDVEPRWYLVFLLLEQRGRLGIMEIAAALGWAHPSVVTVVRQMEARGFLTSTANPDDGRSTRVGLSPRGRAQLARARPVWDAARVAIEELLGEAGQDALSVVTALEAAHARRGFRQRTRDALEAKR